MFEESRTKEYFDVRELQTMTGQPARQFAAVILKELVDNGLDAAEKAGVPPEVLIRVRHVRRSLHLAVRDNGGGIAADTVKRILNFATRTSDKAHYRSPTRGAQGNALKTILGIPYALGCRKPIVIEAQGERHFLRPQIDPAGEVSIEHVSADVAERPGTRFLVAVPAKSCPDFSPHDWAQGFALFNPHALVKIRVDATAGKLLLTRR
jgi:DNA topoisomerase VI subunit B